MLVPIRVWLGAVWLFEGVMKVVEGWLTSPKLTGFFGGAESWYNSILNSGGGTTDGTSSATGAAAETTTQAVQVAADAVSSATGKVAETTVQAIKTAADAVSSATGAGGATGGAAAEQAGNAAAHVGTVIFNFDFLGLFQAFFVSGKELAQSTLSDLAFKLNIPVMDWFVKNVILANDTVQVAMQIFIVVAEILIGLALIGGLFTFPASAFSLVLQFMFITTTGLYLGTFWMIFAAVAVLIGGGRTFGLDYYAIPPLKKAWKKVGWVKKSYLYND